MAPSSWIDGLGTRYKLHFTCNRRAAKNAQFQWTVCYHIQVDSGNEVIDSTAIQFCARKVAAMTGDARKALDICRRSVEIHNTPIKQSPAQTQSKCKTNCTGTSSNINQYDVLVETLLEADCYWFMFYCDTYQNELCWMKRSSEIWKAAVLLQLHVSVAPGRRVIVLLHLTCIWT